MNRKLTFGLELEVVKLTPAAAGLIARHGFGSHFDRTIKGRDGQTLPMTVEEGGGTELVTKPVEMLVRCEPDGSRLEIDYQTGPEIVQALCACAAEVNVSCGLHVHFGRPDAGGKSRWDAERVRTMLLVGLGLEKRLFSLCPSSRTANQYCKPILESYATADLGRPHPTGEVRPRKYDNPKRYCWLNVIETLRQGGGAAGRATAPGLGTIEVRMMGNVRRAEYILAWVKLWAEISALVAFTPSSLALGHCLYAGTLDRAFGELEAAKTAVDKKRPSRPADDRQPMRGMGGSAPESRAVPDAPDRNRSRFENWEAPAVPTAPEPVDLFSEGETVPSWSVGTTTTDSQVGLDQLVLRPAPQRLS